MHSDLGEAGLEVKLGRHCGQSTLKQSRIIQVLVTLEYKTSGRLLQQIYGH